MLGGQGQFHIRATATYSLTSNHRVLAEPEVPVPGVWLKIRFPMTICSRP